MPDNADIAADIVNASITIATLNARAPIAAGAAGECEQCEWWMPRLVDGRCGFCRDGRSRPPDWEPPTPPDTISEASPPARENVMPIEQSRKIEFTGEALRLIEAHAASADLPFKTAAAELIERSADRDTRSPTSSPAGVLSICTIDDLLGELRERFEVAASARDLSADLAAANARAEAAEAKFAQAKALFA